MTTVKNTADQRTFTLALIVTDITNPYFTTLARGVEDAASEAGYAVIFCNTDESEEKESRYLDVLLSRQLDGFLLVPAQSKPDPVLKIQQNHIPLVMLDRRVPGVSVDTVRCDSETGAYDLTQLLLSLGHFQIAMLSGPEGVSTADDRVNGFRKAMAEAGVEIDEQYVLRGEFSQPSGYEMMKKALNLPLRPTAVVAANNFLTIGAMRALNEAGLDVPEDMALVGFDDLPLTMMAFPFLTVASQPAYEIGRQAAELLIKRIQDPNSQGHIELVLPTQVIVRRSSGIPIS